jgi:hypothetical protein
METTTQPTTQTRPVKALSARRDAVQSNKPSAAEAPGVEKQSPRADMSSDEPRITRIARRAHELYMARGSNSNNGHDIDDWLQAEREIDAETDSRSR